MTRPVAMHPVLFFLAVILFFCAHNMERLPLEESWKPLLWMLIPMLVLQGIVVSLRRSRAMAVLLSLFVVMFFSYGQVYDVLEDAGWTVRHLFLMAFWLALFVRVTWSTLRTRSDLANLTRVLNLVSAVLVVVPIVQMTAYTIQGGIPWGWSYAVQDVAPPAGGVRAGQPDIYYIILDRYANEETLRTQYGFDNREFLDFLRGKGFFVAAESHSNYPKTALSLASSLHMNYLDNLVRDPGRRSTSWVPVHAMLRDYPVWHFLKSRGYTFVHFGTRWEPTRINPHADININVFTPPEMIWALAGQTVLHPLGSELRIGLFDSRVLEWERIPHQLGRLPEIARDARPTFTFVHLLIPHGPYVFEPGGAFVTAETVGGRTRRENYRNQLVYANRKVREAIERVLANSPQPPIIVLQGDEGPIPIRFPREGLKFNWKAASDEDLREKSGILNAYYLPGVSREKLYSEITPVNTFRLIFNEYFQTKLPMLPDEQYFPTDDHFPYDFFAATERIRKRPAHAAASRAAVQKQQNKAKQLP